MRLRAVAGLVLTDVATAVTFAVAWGLVWQSCAPPSPNCRTTMCPAVCVNGWSQLPSNLVFGALLGLIPTVVAALGLRYLERDAPDRNAITEVLLVSAAVLIAAAGPILFYL